MKTLALLTAILVAFIASLGAADAPSFSLPQEQLSGNNVAWSLQ